MTIKENKWEPLGKKHNWTKRKGGDITFELKIFDNGQKLDRFIWNSNKEYKRIVEVIRLKYNMNYI